MGDNAPIGIFDSGLGGLTVVREVLSLLPGEDIIYFGDTARTPYGSRPPAEILGFMQEILTFFSAQKVKMAIVACNTMTALGLEQAKTKFPFLLIGVNNGAEAALHVSRNKRIGVIATEATINSGKHAKALKDKDSLVTVYPQACPQFVPLIEQEKLSGPEIEHAAREHLAPLAEGGIDTLILGCTHYPFISPLISDIMGSGVTLVDPARETAAQARTELARHNKLATRSQGTVQLCFSADLKRAERFTACAIDFSRERSLAPRFELIHLQDYCLKV
ncbi:glutamate racemase [Sporomusa acidovorans]|uniref:Glutamate racemase n=1 Tax=Sporomusa acidovorans (strain ATCC 49682 / DSM 3132 / Mol) TaxID=1123286 RepID=A0ABZ3J0A0_SPOA4|nr:glutamate racemase [Sporomusa acidovorans]OZC21354.1 glutamate racemase [Sporomusa acidovorans DSM 3132]SDE56421.1 glutamate racemase [Sporomusa acidovorans]